MLNSRKMVALAGALGGLALTVGGVTQVYANSGEPVCTKDGDSTHCSQKSESRYTSEDGKVVVHQSKSCSSYERNRRIGPFSSGGDSSQGATMSCSNSLPA
ncbi:hypothetical protein LHJ74_08080 [Streptomyces sp. N2-109]|uniref:Uncharacterized protein n=1 Tax=Streptomyces gossypii TaxID=2883101 RepID=A0ABT2JQ53_9ACTN|nr:hypothetical protein [Streptomyces gossypii]MCT2589871.1 hypothetical protein [Streptomyces gossypii]